MTDTNTPASVLAEQIVDAVTDAANLVTCDGYYEIDKEAATNAIIPFLTRNQTDRKTVLEEAAKVAEAQMWAESIVKEDVRNGDLHTEFYNDGCRDAASAIRALKGGGA